MTGENILTTSESRLPIGRRGASSDGSRRPTGGYKTGAARRCSHSLAPPPSRAIPYLTLPLLPSLKLEHGCEQLDSGGWRRNKASIASGRDAPAPNIARRDAKRHLPAGEALPARATAKRDRREAGEAPRRGVDAPATPEAVQTVPVRSDKAQVEAPDEERSAPLSAKQSYEALAEELWETRGAPFEVYQPGEWRSKLDKLKWQKNFNYRSHRKPKKYKYKKGERDTQPGFWDMGFFDPVTGEEN